MRRIIWMLLTVIVAVTATDAQETGAQRNERNEGILIANERALLTAVATADKTSFAGLVLPDGQWTTTQGFVPMKLLADGLSAFQLSKWDTLNPQVRWLTEDSAIVLYAWAVAGTFGNQQLPPTLLSSTVWTKRDGKWLAVHHQDTELAKN